MKDEINCTMKSESPDCPAIRESLAASGGGSRLRSCPGCDEAGSFGSLVAHANLDTKKTWQPREPMPTL
jgi:hypothetical protein